MAISSWQRRIRRAEKLAAQHPGAAEVLGFYVHIARFQESLYQGIERSSAARNRLPATDPDFAELLTGFPPFLALIKSKAPEPLADAARDLENLNSTSLTDLFTQCWTHLDPPAHPSEFLGLIFLQPYAEFLRAHVSHKMESQSSYLCPFCNRNPVFGVLRQLGDGGQRSLSCGFCLCEWEFRRIVCAACGQEDQTKLPIYTAEQFPHLRVECCDNCHTYIKSVDFTKDGLADPLVDELASLPLDLWAQEHGYSKLHPNLLGF